MGYDIGPQIGIDGEAEFRRAIQQVNANIRTLGTEMARVTSEYTRNDKSQENLTKQNKVLNKQMDEQRQKILGLQQGLTESAKKYGENDVKTQKWQQSVNQAVTQLNKMDQQLQGNNTDLAQMADKSQDVEKSLSPIGKQLEVLNSRFKMNTAALGENGTGLDGLKLKGENLAQSMELQKQKIQTLEKAYNQSGESKGKDAEATQDLEIRLNDAKTALSNTEGQLKSTNKEIDMQSSSWLKVGESMQKAGDQMKAVGKKMADVGKSLTMRITAPIMGIGAASSKLVMDFDATMSEVKAISGATGKDFDALREKALQMGMDTSKTATESAQALKYMSLAGWDSKDSIEALEPVLRLSEAGAMDLGLASDQVTDSMSALGLSVKDLPAYLDQTAQTSRKSNTNIQQLGEAMIEAGGTFKNLNVPMEEANAVLGILANRGKKGATAGEALNSIMINLTTGTGQAGEAMKSLGVNAFDSEGKFKGMGNVLKEVKEKTKDMTEEQRNMYLAAIGGKTQLSTLQALLDGVGKEFDSLQGDIKNSDGALNEMATTMQDNFKGKITALKSALEGAGISIGKALLPMLTNLVAKIKELTDKFNALSPAQQETIVKVGLAVAAFGPLLMMSGKVVWSMGMLSKAFGLSSVAAAGATPAVAGLGTTFGAALIPILPWVAAIGAVAVAGVALHKHLSQECIPAVKLFGDETAEGTKKAVGAYMELDKSAGESLTNLKFTGQAVSAETRDALVNNFGQMGEQIKAGMEQKFNETFSSLQTFFTNSSALTEEEEQKILADSKAKNEAEKAELTEHTEQIQAILDVASTEGRELKAEEIQKIEQLQADMKVNAVKCLSETELESLAILERMKQQTGEMTAQQAVEVAQNSLEQKNKAVENANIQYDETVKAIIKQRNESKTISEEQAQKLIADARLQRDESIISATEMHAEVINQAKQQAGEHVAQVNWETGEIKTKGQIAGAFIGSVWKKMGEDVKTSWAGVKETNKAFWEAIGKALTWVGTQIGKAAETIVKTVTQVPGKMFSIGKDIVSGIWKGISASAAWLLGKVKEWCGSILKGIKAFFGIHSPSTVFRDEVGKNIVLGIDKGIQDNGQKVIKTMGELSQHILSEATVWVDDKKFYNQMALQDELSFWEDLKKMEGLKGTELAEIDKKIYSAKQTMRKEEEEAQKKTLDEQKKAFEEYEKNIKSRADSLEGFAGIFDEIKKNSEITGDVLLGNLKGQVEAFKGWQSDMDKLAERGITDGLLSELREMGPKAAEEIHALTTLSESAWQEYVDTFSEKGKLVSEQAQKEIGAVNMPVYVVNDEEAESENTEKVLSISGTIVSDIQQGITAQVPQITAVSEKISREVITTINAFKASFVSVGANITKGIWQGIASEKSTLINNITQMLRDVVRAAKEEMDIHSPSRVWASIGGFMASGLGVGFLDEMEAVTRNIQKSIHVPMVEESSRRTNRETSGTGDNQSDSGDMILYIDHVNNSNDRDVHDFLRAAEFYRKQRVVATGGV